MSNNTIMREIKFRAWDINSCKMFFPTSIDFEYPGMFAFKQTEENQVGLEIEKECFLMEYTGLKDKNGVEIYEGDILSSGKHKSVVKYEKGMFVWSDEPLVMDLTAGTPYEDFFPEEWAIVIGNIYQNPELL